eukprot:TRINITY_DN35532_c0_g1_i1.p1 TRINITY_DN35532_c0_g1~~TRINITY_DN35532_c0_g1_i1.p1  ORF type:complete len:316 (-),score=62.49 TRINITY_DN35532_c0_g1_i1:406-1263(-)
MSAEDKDHADGILQAFQAFDTDGNGTISTAELGALLQFLDPQRWTDALVARLLQQIDTNGDGELQFAEFAAWATKGTSKATRTAVSVAGALMTLQHVPLADKEPAVKLLTVLLTNIAQAETAYRTLSKTSAVLQKLLSIPGCESFLKAVGFVDEGEDSLHLPEAINVDPVLDQLQRFSYSEDLSKHLIVAAAEGDLAKVQQLLACGALVNATCDHVGNTPLHEAAQMGRLEVVESLLAAKASVEAANHQGYTPYAIARDWSPDRRVTGLLEQVSERSTGEPVWAR